MTLQRRVFKAGDSTSNGGLLKHSNTTNSSNVGKLQEECCCTADGNGYVQFIACPSCVAETDCGCSSTYDYRAGGDPVSNQDGVSSAGCGASLSAECTTTGFSNSNACDSMTKGAVYILKDELNSLQIDTDTSGNPRFFDDSSFNFESGGGVTAFKILVGGTAYPFIVDDFSISASTDLSSCQIITKDNFLRDCAGNVMFYGSGAFGSNSYSSSGSTADKRKNLCRQVCENRFWVNATPCDECGPCTSVGEDDDFHYVQAEYAKGLFHIGCSSCSSCNPADATGKVVNGLGTHCYNNDSYTILSGTVYKDPWNVKKEFTSYSHESHCGAESDGRAPSNCDGQGAPSRFNAFIRGISSTSLGAAAPNIDCTLTCDSTTQNSPFSDCSFALSDGEACGSESCSCCCPDHFFNICRSNCSTTYTVSCPSIPLTSSNNCPGGPFAAGGGGFMCVDDDLEADCTIGPDTDICSTFVTCNVCDLLSNTPSANVVVSQPLNFGDCSQSCRYESPGGNRPECFFPQGGSSIATTASAMKAHCDLVSSCPSQGFTGCTHSEVLHSSPCQGEYVSGVLQVQLGCDSTTGKYRCTISYAMFVGANGSCDSILESFNVGPMFTVTLIAEKDDASRCPQGTYTGVAIGPTPPCGDVGDQCVDQDLDPSTITVTVS